MIELFNLLKLRIETDGPLTLADYMVQALGHAEYGYYRKRDPLGTNGDFITSPEISQMFGELIGIWSAICWQQLGSPSKINLVELGPGRGTLLADALKAAKGVPGYFDAIAPHLIESSPILVERQRHNLSPYGKACLWHKAFEEVPDGPFVLIANEFLDALPMRQFVNDGGEWCERLIDLDKNGTSLCWTTSTCHPPSEFLVPSALCECEEGMIWEISPATQQIITSVSSAISERRGSALFIDYGYVEQTGGDTFQAVRNHNYVDPLQAPGDADLTTHVDFGAIKRVAEENGVRVSGPVTQGDFLRGLGIERRAERLMAEASARQQSHILTGLKRLTGENEMGALFKVLALSHPKGWPPEGF